MSRPDATDLLMNEREGGVFLVRDSTTILGDFVLCVRQVIIPSNLKIGLWFYKNEQKKKERKKSINNNIIN